MRITTERDPIVALVGEPQRRYVTLTRDERATLERARAILEAADDLQRTIDDDPDGDNPYHYAEASLQEVLA